MEPNLLTNEPQYIPTRNGFGEGLLELGSRDDRIVALCADLTESTKMDAFARAFPQRFVEIGVAEQNLVTVASGMAAMGKIPFCSSYAMFSPGRNWEQIRTTIAYNDRKVIIVGSHTGVSVGPDGGTHQALEDIALMRVIPNMIVIQPCDSIEAKKATLALGSDQLRSPAYLRLTREKTRVMTNDETPFEIGKAYIMWKSETAHDGMHKKIAIIGCGPILDEALQAAGQLDQLGYHVHVINMHTIKPLDTEMLDTIAKSVDMIVTVEEHQIAGGLGSAIAEYLSQHNPTHIQMIGVRDAFGQSGTPRELLEHYHITAKDIVEKVIK
jgi:transketolase